ncbi:MAG: two-component sensor histidine kinase [Rhizobiaceae bacterium]|nr:two-component sensor histidine kinase [Rhizobiaceae bacterium]
MPANGLMFVVAIVAIVLAAVLGTPAGVVVGVFLVAAAAIVPTSRRREKAQIAARALEKTSLGGLSPQNLAEAVGDPLVIFDRQGATVHANAAARKAFGDLPAGMSLLLKFRAPELQDLIQSVLTGQAGEKAVDYVERVPLERVYRVVGASVGEQTGLFLLTFRDQSEARRVDRMRADFIANASHELRTPLASISGFIETLRGPARNDAKARDQFLQIMQDQTARMARLIDDLLSLSRLEMKALPPAGRPVDLQAVVEAVLDALTPLARESGVEVKRDFGHERMQVAGDRDELFQVFENLLENACKYGQSGGRLIVSIRPSASVPGEAEVAVTDFGPGIPAEHIPRITERFYRVDVETSRSRKGTGLGLAIVKHILTRHHSRLSIRSEPGKGATFTAHLPTVRRRN